MHSRKPQGSHSSWNTATIFILLQLLVVWLIYYLHQRSLRTIQGIGPAEWEQRSLIEQNTLRASEGPTENSGKISLSPAVNCSPSSVVTATEKIVRLHEADVEMLRTEVFKIADSVISSKGFADAAESRTAALLMSGEELPPVPRDSQLMRLSDEHHRPNPTSNIPGVQDIHAELREYTERMLETWTRDFFEAKKRQHRPTAAELNLHALDSLEDTASLPQRIAFLNELVAIAEAEQRNKAEKDSKQNTNTSTATATTTVAIATTTSVDLLGVRREILPWIQYHTEIGVSQFYILYDGNDSAAVDSLNSINNVEILNIKPQWASPEELVLWETHLKLSTLQSQGSKGNYELMIKQGFCLQQALRRAQERNQAISRLAAAVAAGEAEEGLHTEPVEQQQQKQIEWLMHLDPDELFLPGGNEASIRTELSRQPPHVPAVRFLNYEGQPELGNVNDVVNRFEQVTLFRAHKHFITPEAFWYRNRFKLGENAAFLYLYANGKSAVRVNAPGVRSSGPHYFTGDASERWVSPENPSGLWVNAVSDTSIVLHYAYSNPAEVAAKAHRSCPGNFTAAAEAGDREFIKKSCFVIEFDADAFMAAVQGEDAVNDFYFSRMVLSEGVAVKCASKLNAQGWCSLTNIPRFIHLMEKIGLMKRVLLPQAILRQQERVFQNFWSRRL
jgi:hypothetical protein